MTFMKQIIEDRQFDIERALYNLKDTRVSNCIFAGPADGESVLKEARDIEVDQSQFSLRYPMWHVKGFTMTGSTMDEYTRAALWYADHGKIKDCTLGGIKAVRECNDIQMENCKIDSPEFGWKCNNIILKDSSVTSEYIFLDSKNIRLDNVKMNGKYSFQYIENLEISNCDLDTKDAFWHSKNVTVRDSVIKGEYLAWFSEGLTQINCKIIGTQPLCYCKDLKLINCTMQDTDLAFEYSDVTADIRGNVESIKNPKSGTITVDSVGAIIHDDPVMECSGQVAIRN